MTLDLIYKVEHYPRQNQKVVANDYQAVAGGPATNAAVTFSVLGNQSVWLGVLGQHPVTGLMRADLAAYNLEIRDLEPGRWESPPVSSIVVSQATGDRAVVSINATKSQGAGQAFSPEILADIQIVLIDGHQMAVSAEVVKLAKAKKIPIVVDAGSWKPGFESILPWVDFAICSANFYPPGCQNAQDVFAYFDSIGVHKIAITRGEQPIQYCCKNETGLIEVSCVNAVDTLGAGDIFHGAFCHYILQQDFVTALRFAAQVASYSCEFFGTRQWLKTSPRDFLNLDAFITPSETS